MTSQFQIEDIDVDEACPTPPLQPAASSFSAYMVRVHSLVARHDLNGKMGISETYDAAADRYRVCVLGSNERVNIRSASLKFGKHVSLMEPQMIKTLATYQASGRDTERIATQAAMARRGDELHALGGQAYRRSMELQTTGAVGQHQREHEALAVAHFKATPQSHEAKAQWLAQQAHDKAVTMQQRERERVTREFNKQALKEEAATQKEATRQALRAFKERRQCEEPAPRRMKAGEKAAVRQLREQEDKRRREDRREAVPLVYASLSTVTVFSAADGATPRVRLSLCPRDAMPERGPLALGLVASRLFREYDWADKREPFGKDDSGRAHRWLRMLRGAEAHLQSAVGTSYSVRSSMGCGAWAKVPWLVVADPRETTQHGLYLQYLFAADMSCVYLCLGQGTSKLKAAFGSATATHHLHAVGAFVRMRCRALLGADAQLGRAGFDLDGATDLRAGPNSGLAQQYAQGVIVSKRYAAAAMPSEAELLLDLTSLLRVYAHVLDDDEYVTQIVRPTDAQLASIQGAKQRALQQAAEDEDDEDDDTAGDSAEEDELGLLPIKRDPKAVLYPSQSSLGYSGEEHRRVRREPPSGALGEPPPKAARGVKQHPRVVLRLSGVFARREALAASKPPKRQREAELDGPEDVRERNQARRVAQEAPRTLVRVLPEEVGAASRGGEAAGRAVVFLTAAGAADRASAAGEHTAAAAEAAERGASEGVGEELWADEVPSEGLRKGLDGEAEDMDTVVTELDTEAQDLYGGSDAPDPVEAVGPRCRTDSSETGAAPAQEREPPEELAAEFGGELGGEPAEERIEDLTEERAEAQSGGGGGLAASPPRPAGRPVFRPFLGLPDSNGSDRARTQEAAESSAAPSLEAPGSGFVTAVEGVGALLLSSRNGTGYQGVSRQTATKGAGSFLAMLSWGGVSKYIGSFPTALEAAICYTKHKQLLDAKSQKLKRSIPRALQGGVPMPHALHATAGGAVGGVAQEATAHGMDVDGL